LPEEEEEEGEGEREGEAAKSTHIGILAKSKR
jgi:hypothetical protein